MTRWLSFALLLLIIVAVGIVFYRVMIGFVLPLFLAAILVIMFRPLYRGLLDRWKGRERLAALVTTLAVVLMVLLPMGLILTLAAIEASTLAAKLRGPDLQQKRDEVFKKLQLEYEFAAEIRYLESSLETLQADARHGATAHGDPLAYQRLVDVSKQLHDRLAAVHRTFDSLNKAIEEFTELTQYGEQPLRIGTLEYQKQLEDAADRLRAFKLELLGGEMRSWLKEVANPTNEEISALSAKFFSGAPGFLRSVGGATTGFLASLVIQGAIMIFAMYFFLTDGPSMVRTFMRLSPLDDSHERELIDEFDRITRAVVLATILSAVIQGLLAGIGFWIAGVGAIFLLTMLTIIFAMVPFVGAASVWLPACLWLYFSEGRPVAAILLGVYGALIVSSSDNFIKPLVLAGQSNLHPLLALLSVLGGVQALGPIGILVGPMVVVFLQTLLNILQREIIYLEHRNGPPIHGTAVR